jgi:tRNA(Leu) C34 or U34 (ribose-2'-O)-methylase TrmL
VDFICAIGARTEYKQASNTTKAEKHIPVFNYKDINDFLSNIPLGCEIVSVEIDGEDISGFKHPERAIYLFGGEDRTLPQIAGRRIAINTNYCLNMATTSAIILYDRQIKNPINPMQFINNKKLK